MVVDSQGGGEDAEYQEWLGSGLVLDVVLQGIFQQVCELCENLWDDESEEDGGVGGFADGVEVGRHGDLSRVDESCADVLGTVDAEFDGQRLQAELGVSFDGLEVVDDGDAEAGQRVERGENDDGPRQFASARSFADGTEHGLAAPPRKGDVRSTEGEAAAPSFGLELEGRSRVQVRHDRSKDRDAEDGIQRICDNVVAGPNVQSSCQGESSDEETDNLGYDLALCDASAGNRSVRLVDGVEFAIVPVVQRLGVSGQQRARQNHASDDFGKVFGSVTEGGSGSQQSPAIISAGRSTTGAAPNQRNPGRGLRKLQSNLPQRLVVGLRSASEPYELPYLRSARSNRVVSRHFPGYDRRASAPRRHSESCRRQGRERHRTPGQNHHLKQGNRDHRHAFLLLREARERRNSLSLFMIFVALLFTSEATALAANSRPFMIGVAGGTASGKTALTEKLVDRLDASAVSITQDSFYRDLSPSECASQYNFDNPAAFDFESTYDVLTKLRRGEKDVCVPCYDFVANARMAESRLLTDSPSIVVFEGILALYDQRLRDLFDLRIFVDADPDIRLARRIRRDIESRGRDLDSVLTRYLTFVKPSFDDFCYPTKRYADVVVPRGAENVVAIDLIVSGIKQRCGQPAHER